MLFIGPYQYRTKDTPDIEYMQISFKPRVTIGSYACQVGRLFSLNFLVL